VRSLTEEVYKRFYYKGGHLYYKHKHKQAGCYDKDGYRVVKINRKSYKEHHLVWLFWNKNMPKYLHHRNGVRDDNRITNLEEVNHEENMKHKSKYKNNTSGFVGIDFKNGKYRARVGQKHVGYYSTLKDAVAGRMSYMEV